jgi:hypothetical protein
MRRHTKNQRAKFLNKPPVCEFHSCDLAFALSVFGDCSLGILLKSKSMACYLRFFE